MAHARYLSAAAMSIAKPTMIRTIPFGASWQCGIWRYFLLGQWDQGERAARPGGARLESSQMGGDVRHAPEVRACFSSLRFRA